jgi:hypothetical protein
MKQLSTLNWNNVRIRNNLLHSNDVFKVIVAGGAVMACLLEGTQDKKKWYHDTAYITSDIDLFMYGLTEGETFLHHLTCSILNDNMQQLQIHHFSILTKILVVLNFFSKSGCHKSLVLWFNY